MTSTRELNVERYSALVISVATIGTAWCAFQASVWSGRQAFALAESNAAYRRAIFAHNEANQERLLDVQLFLGLADAYYGGRERAVTFYLDRFPKMDRENLEAAMEAAMARKHLSLEDFKDTATLAAERKRDDAIDLAHRKHNGAARANHRSDLYILITVLFASSLFFAGMADKFNYPSIQRYFLLGGSGLVLVGLVLIARLPVAF